MNTDASRPGDAVNSNMPLSARSLASALDNKQLSACAKDAIGWQRSGDLVDGPLQAFAQLLVSEAGLDEEASLQHAEAAVLREVAERFVAAVDGARVPAPKPLHPEQRAGEIHLCDLELAGAHVVGWNTKRIGFVAYGSDGTPVAGKVPVFVQVDEFKAAGQWAAHYTVKA